MLTTGHTIEHPLARFGLHAPVTSRRSVRALDTFFAQAPLRHMKAKEPLFTEGDLKSHVFQVESGAVLVYKILSDGFRQIVNFAFAGDLIGLDASTDYSFDAETIAPTKLRAVSSSALLRHASVNASVAKEMFETLSRDVEEARTHLLTVGRLRATGRLATFLMTLSKRNEAKGFAAETIMLPVRRSDIADFLCLSVETVSRSLTELKEAKVISLCGWRQIKLNDRDALEAIASGESA